MPNRPSRTLDRRTRSWPRCDRPHAPPRPADQRRPRRRRCTTIVVVGGGAGGLELVDPAGRQAGQARQGRRSPWSSARARHLWKPLLHEVAAGSMDLDDHALDYLAQAHWHHFRYRFGEMIGLDRAGKEVLPRRHPRRGGPPGHARARRPLRHPGHRDRQPQQRFRHARRRRSTRSRWTRPTQAARFNRRLVNACLRAHTQAEPVRPGQLHVAIIGAGATGTELSAELHRTARAVVAYGLDRIDPEKDIQITLIEAADRILPGPAASASPTATTGLLREPRRRRPHRARASPRCSADGVQLADGGFIPSELVVWAAGVQGPGRAGRPRRARGQPQQPARGPAHPADHARPRHLRHRRLRLAACREGHDRPGAAARPDRAPAGEPRAAARSAAGSRASRCSPSSTATSARWSRLGRVLDRRQPDGLHRRQEHVHRGLVRPADVPLALQDAPDAPCTAGPRWRSSTLARTLTRRTEPHVKLH